MRAGIEELLQTLPDYHIELVDAFGSGDRLVLVDGVAVATPGGSIHHKPAQQGFGGFFPNLFVGWAFDL